MKVDAVEVGRLQVHRLQGRGAQGAHVPQLADSAPAESVCIDALCQLRAPPRAFPPGWGSGRTLIDPSPEAEARTVPDRLDDRSQIRDEWPRRTDRHSARSMSHTRTVLSLKDTHGGMTEE